MRHSTEHGLTRRAIQGTDVFVCTGAWVKPERNDNLRASREAKADDFAARVDRLEEVRRDVVARGKMLIADPNYPDARTMRGVAGVLARHWRR